MASKVSVKWQFFNLFFWGKDLRIVRDLITFLIYQKLHPLNQVIYG